MQVRDQCGAALGGLSMSAHQALLTGLLVLGEFWGFGKVRPQLGPNFRWYQLPFSLKNTQTPYSRNTFKNKQIKLLNYAFFKNCTLSSLKVFAKIVLNADDGTVPWLQTMSSLKVFISSSLPSESSGPNSTMKQCTKNVTAHYPEGLLVQFNTKMKRTPNRLIHVDVN